jgi:ketosteroid isomerase-like protein
MLMRIPVALTTFVLVMLIGPAETTLRAQAPTTPQEEAEHEALRELRRVYEQAVGQNQLDLLQPYIHPEFTGVMMTGRAVSNFEEVRDYWSDIRGLIGEGGRYTTTVNPEWSTLFGEVAVARGTTDDVVVTGEGREFRFQSFWTAVLQKHDGRWKIRRVHGSMDPITNPFVREFTRRAVLQSGLVGGVVGLVLGVLVALVLSRRRARRSAA